MDNLSLNKPSAKFRAASDSPKIQLRVARPEFLRLEQKQLPTFNRPKRLMLKNVSTPTEPKEHPLLLANIGEKHVSGSESESLIQEQKIPSKGFFQLSKKPRRVSGVKTLTPSTQQAAWKAVTKTDHQIEEKQPYVGQDFENETDPKRSYSRLQVAFKLLMNEQIDGYVHLDVGDSPSGAQSSNKFIKTLNLDVRASKQIPRFDFKNFTSTQSLSTKSILIKNRLSKESSSQYGPSSPKKRVEFAKNKMVVFFDSNS